MQINIAKNSVDKMPILFHMLLPTSCASKWYQWLRIWLSRNIRCVGVNVGMSARNRHFQTNYWCITLYLNEHYNMVGVAVAMVISTMHEKSCIDSHNARKFEKSPKIQSFASFIRTTRNHNDEIAEVSPSWISYVIITIRRNYPESYF